MKTRSVLSSVLSSVLGSVLFASAVTMLLPTLASATFQDSGSPPPVRSAAQPRLSQAMPMTASHLSAQQMQATKGAFGMICNGDCNNGVGVNSCVPSSLYPPVGGLQCNCSTIYYHHLVCAPNNNILILDIQNMVLCCGK